MPFKSSKQRRFMFAKHPAIAKRWAAKYGTKPVGKKKKRVTKKPRRPKTKMSIY